jgi:bla regulator protein BlaR1
MGILESSGSWVIALGKTLLHSFWTGFLILALLKILFLFVSYRLARLRYLMATAALILFTASVVVLFFFLYGPVRESHYPTVVSARFVLPLTVGTKNDPGWLGTVCLFSTCFYLTGIIVYLVRTLLSASIIHRIRRSGTPVGGTWAERFVELTARAGIIGHPSLLQSDRLDTPVLAGFLKPVIIVPVGIFTQMPFEQVESVLLHELFHLKHLDHLANILQRLAEIIFFYHPAVWSLSTIIRAERENRCDDLVIRASSQPLDYAKALYQLAIVSKRSPGSVSAVAGTSRGQLKDRILRILNPSDMKTGIREKLVAPMLLIGSIIIVLVMNSFSRVPEEHSTSAMIHATGQPLLQDTLPAKVEVQPVTGLEEDKKTDREEIHKAMEEIDWEELHKEIEQARKQVMEETDWEELRKEMEQAGKQAMEEIDWEELRKEIEQARKQAMEEIDWEEVHKEIEEAKIHAMEAINMDELQQAIEAIDWDQIKVQVEAVKIHLDSLMKEIDLDFDLDF